MTAAHEGVPVRDLPGSWHPSPGGAVAPVTVSEDEDQTPMPTMRPSVPVQASAGSRPAVAHPATAPANVKPPAAIPNVAVRRSRQPLDNSRTASVSRPVPPADVGGSSRRGGLSILDVILGGRD